jgi:hypothetical protein
MGDPDVVGETVMTLHAFNIPLILASPRLAESVVQEGNILTTAPDMSSVVKVRKGNACGTQIRDGTTGAK